MGSLKGNSISRRLTWMNMVVSGAALLLACLAFIGYDIDTFRLNVVQNLSLQAEMVGSNSASALLFDDPDTVEHTLSAFRNAPHILSAGIYKPDGKVFATYRSDRRHEAPSQLTPFLGTTESHWFENGQIVLVQPIVFQGSLTGIVYIRSDSNALYERLKRYVWIVAIVLLISMIAALLVSSVAQRAISDPIVQLSKLARIISHDKNYSVRATPTGNLTELFVLIESFNEMLTQIQERDKALQKGRDELEDRIQERTNQLAASNQELEAFSYSVSHDLRAPLRSIDGFSQALLEDYADTLDTEGKGHLKRVRLATQRMSQLIDDLLNLSRMTRSEMRRERVDLSILAKSVIGDLRKEEPGRCVNFEIADGLMADGDSHLLRIVIANLLGNAWKYTSRHSCAQIELGRRESNGRVVYFVRDDGAGFEPTYSSRLFGAFQRLHSEKEFSGTGIGLATVQRIVHRHGGKVWAEGAVEKGATFYFTL